MLGLLRIISLGMFFAVVMAYADLVNDAQVLASAGVEAPTAQDVAAANAILRLNNRTWKSLTMSDSLKLSAAASAIKGERVTGILLVQQVLKDKAQKVLDSYSHSQADLQQQSVQEAELLKAQMANLEAAMNRAQQRNASLARSNDNLKKSVADQRKALNKLKSRFTQSSLAKQRNTQQAKAMIDQLQAQLQERETLLAAADERRQESATTLSELQGQIQQLSTQLAADQTSAGGVSAVATAIEQLQQKVHQVQAAADLAEGQVQAKNAEINDLQDKLTAAVEAAAQAQEQQSEASAKANDLQGRITDLEQEIDLLSASKMLAEQSESYQQQLAQVATARAQELEVELNALRDQNEKLVHAAVNCEESKSAQAALTQQQIAKAAEKAEAPLRSALEESKQHTQSLSKNMHAMADKYKQPASELNTSIKAFSEATEKIDQMLKGLPEKNQALVVDVKKLNNKQLGEQLTAVMKEISFYQDQVEKIEKELQAIKQLLLPVDSLKQSFALLPQDLQDLAVGQLVYTPIKVRPQ